MNASLALLWLPLCCAAAAAERPAAEYNLSVQGELRLAPDGTVQSWQANGAALAPTVAHAERAARAYKDINRLGLKLLRPGGVLFTYSCSGGIGVELFQKIVAGAALDAGVDAAIVQRQGGSADHPVSLNFPEGEYLKGLVVVKRS